MTTDAGFEFPKTARVLRRWEFVRVQRDGRRTHTRHFTVAVYARGDGGRARLGVTASRKSGNAVARNRVRRRIREVFRLNPAAFPTGADCVVIVRENVPDLAFATVRDEILGAMSRARPSSGPSSTRRAARSNP